MLASAAVNLGMASMTLPSKQPQTPPALPARLPVGFTTPTTSPRPSLSPAGLVPPPLPILPPKGTHVSLETTNLDDCKYFSMTSFHFKNAFLSLQKDYKSSQHINIMFFSFSCARRTKFQQKCRRSKRRKL